MRMKYQIYQNRTTAATAEQQLWKQDSSDHIGREG